MTLNADEKAAELRRLGHSPLPDGVAKRARAAYGLDQEEPETEAAPEPEPQQISDEDREELEAVYPDIAKRLSKLEKQANAVTQATAVSPEGQSPSAPNTESLLKELAELQKSPLRSQARRAEIKAALKSAGVFQ